MDYFIMFYVPILMTVVFSILGRIFYLSFQKVPEEEGKKPLYEERIGGTCGLIRYKGPFIRLAIYEQFLLIRYSKAIVLNYDQIQSIQIKKSFFVSGLEIIADSSPSKFFLWPRNPHAILKIVEEKRNQTSLKD
jgi:hypothetical protein